jgi:Domain of unknown function (DUF5666)
VDLKGAVSGLHGSCPTITFAVSDRTVVADPNTEFKKDGCEAVKNGVTVQVRGTTQADGTVIASRIDIEKSKKDEGE